MRPSTNAHRLRNGFLTPSPDELHRNIVNARPPPSPAQTIKDLMRRLRRAAVHDEPLCGAQIMAAFR